MKQIDIFYADDDEDDLGFFNEVTDQISEDIDVLIKLHTHINGENLIENIKKNKGENTIVFLDINMPFKSGFEFLEEIRKEPGINSIPIVMYSTSSNQDNIEKSFALGA